MDTLQGNKIIAEFMEIRNKQGFTFYVPYYLGNTLWLGKNNPPQIQKDIENKILNVGQLEFHTSWDWLYPVYQKLFTLKFCTSLKLHWGRRMGPIRKLIADGADIKEVFERIVIAIQWYIQNKVG